MLQKCPGLTLMKRKQILKWKTDEKLENAQPGILFIRENIIYKLKC